MESILGTEAWTMRRRANMMFLF